MEKKIKVMSVFGTRPEAIKMAPLVIELEKNPNIESVVCVTAQHRQMLAQVLEIFEITPDYDMNLMMDRQTLVQITARVLEGLDDIIKEVKPDIVLVHGDTTTSFVGALAAFYNQVPVGHVEAGLRTYDIYSPFPEEMNRCLTGRIAELNFSPTVANKENLLRENVSEDSIYITGNTVIDAMKTTVKEDFTFVTEELNKIDYMNKKVITMTAHRRENLGEPLKNICNAVKRLVERYEDAEVVYPVHMNPAVRETVFDILGDLDRVHLIEPINVDELHNLMARSYLIMTDSGGIQEEAPSLAKPVLVLRRETERPEAVAAGTVKIAGVDEDVIFDLACELFDDKDAYNKMAHAANPYGDGNASLRIIDAILYHFGVLTNRPEDYRN